MKITITINGEELALLLRILRFAGDPCCEWDERQREGLDPLTYRAQTAALDRLLNRAVAARDEALAKLKRGDDL